MSQEEPADQAELKCPDQIEKEPVLFGLGTRSVANLFGAHVAQTDRQWIDHVVCSDDLMAAHVGAASGVKSEVIVVYSVPDGGAFDVLVIIRELPVAFILGAAECES